MRFRAKFGALGWCYVGLACFFAFLWISGDRHVGFVSLVLGFSLLTLQRVLNHIFVYWDIDSIRLFERRLWNTREIPWCEITNIASWTPDQPSSDFLEVSFARPAPMSDRGSVIANPEDREAFIAALHKFAPQAEFDV